jgi:hypothetical protein
MLPAGVFRWKIHLSGSRGDARLLGATSYYIDLDRWNGDDLAVANYFNKQPVIELSMAEKVDLLWAAHPELG